MESAETRLAVMEEKMISADAQIKRLISHIESEQRVSVNHERRIDSTEKSCDRIQKQQEKHETVLFNSGKGLVLDVRDIKNKMADESNRKEVNWTKWLSIAAIIITVADIIVNYLK